MSDDIKSPLPPRRVNVAFGGEITKSTPEAPQNPFPAPPLDLNPPQSPFDKGEVSKKNTFDFKKYLPIVGGIILILIIIGVVIAIKGRSPVAGEEVSLNYWGLWEDPSVIETSIAEFQNKNPGIKVTYKKNSKDDYRSRLQAKLGKSDTATDVPDIFRIHADWLPMFTGQLAAVPVATEKAIELSDDFFDVYKQGLKSGNSFVAIPMMYDGLALFYNKNLLDAAGKTPPKTWWGLRDLAKKMTVKGVGGRIEVAGVAMGLTDNVDHWSDIIGLMMLQNGVDPYAQDPANQKKLQDILTFYTLFKTNDKVWDESLPPSTQDFADGKLAFYFGPSWRVFDIENLKTADLRYEITGVPQLPTLEGIAPEKIESGEVEARLTNINWASYWVEAVNIKSKHQKEAWKFLEFLVSKENLRKMYTGASAIRSFGEIYPRKSLAAELTSNKLVAPFIRAADSADSWYLASRTFDNGLNDEMAVYFGNAINAMIGGAGAEKVMTDLANGVNSEVNKYKLTK